jgi:hypothetical protein
MRFNGSSFVLLALAGAGTACAHTPVNLPGNIQGNSAVAPIAFGTEQTRVTGEYIVTLAAGSDDKVIFDLYKHFRIKSIKDLGAGLFQLTLTDDPGPEKMEELRKQDSRIKAIQPNFVYRTNSPAESAK